MYDRKTFYGGGAEGYTDYPNRHRIGDPHARAYSLIEQSRVGLTIPAKTQS